MKPPAPSPDLTALQAAVAALTARMTACEANVAALHADDTAVAARLTLDEAAAVDDEARLTTLEASGGVFDPTAIDAEIVALDARVDALEAGGGGDPGTPPDGNAYPLHPAAPQTVPGTPIDLGTGPDLWQFSIGVHQGSGASELAVILNSHAIAAPIHLAAVPPAGPGDPWDFTTVLSVHGSWGTEMPTVEIVPTGVGLHNLNYLGMEYNYEALVYNGPGTFRGDGVHINSPTIWNNSDLPTTWTAPVAVAPPPPPVPEPTLTIVHGATINGTVAADATLEALIAAVPADGMLLLPAGTIVGTSAVPVAMTIEGAGMGQTIIDCTGLKPTYSKAVLVPLVVGVSIHDLTITGAAISAADGGNAAGVRDADNGIGFSLVNVEIHNCQNGILTFESNITTHGCVFHDNGASDIGGGHTHESYCRGNAATTVDFTDHTAVCGLLATHADKSRAGTSRRTRVHLTGSHDNGLNGGAICNIPDGGLVFFEDVTLQMGAGAGNDDLFSYAVETTRNAAAGNTVTWKRTHVIDTSGSGGVIRSGDPAAVLVLDGCTYAGTVPPVLVGWATPVVGAFTAAP